MPAAKLLVLHDRRPVHDLDTGALIGTVDLPAIVTDSLETGGSDVWGYVA